MGASLTNASESLRLSGSTESDRRELSQPGVRETPKSPESKESCPGAAGENV